MHENNKHVNKIFSTGLKSSVQGVPKYFSNQINGVGKIELTLVLISRVQNYWNIQGDNCYYKNTKKKTHTFVGEEVFIGT